MACRGKIIPGLLLAILIAWVAAAYGQTTAYFDGKITEISKATSLGLGETGTFFIIRLDSKPKMEFRISREDAVKYGLIEAGASGVLITQQPKGLGWRVKLTCSREEKAFSSTPIYQVKSLERMND